MELSEGSAVHITDVDAKHNSGAMAAIFIGALLCFAVGNTSIELYEHLLLKWHLAVTPENYVGGSSRPLLSTAINQAVVPLRGLVFYVGLALIVVPSAPRSLRLPHLVDVWPAILASALLSLLVFRPFAVEMGAQYAVRSLDPFAQPTDFYFRRILLPAIANLTCLRGFLLYNVFQWAAKILVPFAAFAWFKKYGGPTSVLAVVALCTSGIPLYAFLFPGYADPFVLLLAIIPLLVQTSSHQRVAITALCMSLHDAIGFIVLLPIVLIILPRKEVLYHIAVFALFGLTASANFSMSVGGLVHAQSTFARGATVMDCIRLRPISGPVGIFFAQKALWVLWGLGIAVSVGARQYRNALFIFATALVGLPLVFLGMDTARLSGLGTLGVLAAVSAVWCRGHRRLVIWTLTANLLIPSATVLAGMLPYVAPGVYRIVWRLMHL